MPLLRKIGHFFKILIVDGDKVAIDIGPAIGFLLPGWGTLFNLVAGMVAQAEDDLNPDGAVRGNGPAKKTQVAQTAEAMFQKYEKISGNTVDRSAFIDGVVMAMNATANNDSN